MKQPQRTITVPGPFGSTIKLTANSTASGQTVAVRLASPFTLHRVEYSVCHVDLALQDGGEWKYEQKASGGMYLKRSDGKEASYGDTFSKIRDGMVEAARAALADGKVLDESFLAEDIERRDQLIAKRQEAQQQVFDLNEQIASVSWMIDMKLANFNK